MSMWGCADMYSLLIVEDEELIRKGMRHCLDWSGYQIDKVEEADNGQLGLDMAIQMRPDIVITDVVMAEMDGIEFVRRLRQEITDKPIWVIIISGHEDVDYIRSALKLQVVDFLLKPFHTEELEEVLRKVIRACEDERKQNAHVAYLEQRNGQSQSIVRERFLQDLCYRQVSDEEIALYMEFLGESFSDYGSYRAVFIESDKAQSHVEEALRSMAPMVAVFPIDRGAYGGIVFDTGPEWLPQAGLRIGLGCGVMRLADLHRSFQQARVSLLFLPETMGEGTVLAYQAEVAGDMQEVLLSDMALQESMILAAMENGDRDALHAALEVYFELVLRLDRTKLDYLRAFSSMLLIQIRRHFAVLGERSALITAALEQISVVSDIQGLRQLMMQTLAELTVIINDKPDQRKVVRLIHSYIQSAFREELTLAQIAAQVHLSPNYLASVFKKETGITVNAYITDVRLAEAKRLLQSDRQLLIHDLAEQVGYKDSKYFTKLFKRECGMNPSEYREKFG
ncbi:response regulator [Paenibacillus sp. HWE-109]|uniref:response regulator n=1 Tax=Paenibacillus sp. HWE-109 TaxID=1306526 RepID=UPI001EDCED9F|nr:response regulator [Paenibacillus sp. HWE-109]UKS30987.1 response regulator [Paenibacillus sp. HWE-109]